MVNTQAVSVCIQIHNHTSVCILIWRTPAGDYTLNQLSWLFNSLKSTHQISDWSLHKQLTMSLTLYLLRRMFLKKFSVKLEMRWISIILFLYSTASLKTTVLSVQASWRESMWIMIIRGFIDIGCTERSVYILAYRAYMGWYERK